MEKEVKEKKKLAHEIIVALLKEMILGYNGKEGFYSTYSTGTMIHFDKFFALLFVLKNMHMSEQHCAEVKNELQCLCQKVEVNDALLRYAIIRALETI